MSEAPQRKRGRPWWRSRRLIALIVALDLAGGAALAYALTRSSSTVKKVVVSVPAAQIQPATGTNLTATHATQSHRRPALPPASAGVTPSMLAAEATSRQAGGRARTGASGRLGSSARASFDRFAPGQPGQVGVAIAPLGAGQTVTFGSLQVGHAWSTMKVPVLSTLLAQLEQQGQTLGPTSQQDATLALEQSDNSAAEALFSELEASDSGLSGASAAVQDTLRRAGDTSTVINTAPNTGGFTTWGQSEWSTSGEVAFYRSLANGCLLSSSDTRFVLGLMQNVGSDQRWGAGTISVPGGLPLAFKGGWGPDSDHGGGYLVRQSAIVGTGDRGWVFSMIAVPSDGAFATGTNMLSAIAGWVARTVPLDASNPGGGCG